MASSSSSLSRVSQLFAGFAFAIILVMGVIGVNHVNGQPPLIDNSVVEEVEDLLEPPVPAPPPAPSPSRAPPPASTCSLSPALRSEIASYQQTANLIMDTAIRGSFKGRTYNDLAYFVDRFGSRFVGSQALEKSIDFMLGKMEQDGLDNVHGEEVQVPHWVRRKESAEVIAPRSKKMAILGLGFSTPTPKGGITAEVLVVRNFDELTRNAAVAKGKIIVFNEKWVNYSATAVYRYHGAAEASKVGGVAVLIRSVTPFSINSPHTGKQRDAALIPAACITIEDAQLLQRWQNRGTRIVIRLRMNSTMLPPTKSRNVVGEIVGRPTGSPKELVTVSGHIDSWDVGQGAMDDGGGAFISEEALALLKSLNLQPRRTLRSILFTGEEVGLVGGHAYGAAHASELSKISAALESDHGTFDPTGFDFAGGAEAGCIVREVVKLLGPINATGFNTVQEIASTDIIILSQKGVPSLGLATRDGRWYWFHHTQGDTMTVQNSDALDECLAAWATVAYVLADLSVALPRAASTGTPAAAGK